MKKQMRQREKRRQQDIAGERIALLFEQASKAAQAGDSESANRFAEHARAIAMKTNTPFTREQRRQVCKHCGHFLAYGKNAEHRMDSGNRRVEVACHDCGKKTWWPYVAEKKKTDAT